MINTSTLVSDVKEDFEGGVSLAVNWDSLIRRAVRTIVRQLRPENLKRRVPIYGGLAHEVSAYYCPNNVLVPSDLYTNDGERKFEYRAPKAFHAKEEHNTYTIETINGARFLFVRHALNLGSVIIDAMEAVGTKTGGSPALNSHQYLIGSNSIEATFTSAGVEFGDDLTTALDISDYLRGVVILPTHIPIADNLVSIEVRLKTDDSNYYKLISTSDSIGDYFIDGWNNIKFEMQNATQEGTPTASNITEWSIIGTTASGTTMKLSFDKFTIQKFNPYYLEFYTDAAFVNATSGALWQTTVSSNTGDKVNFNDDLADILHYELCMLVVQAATFDSIDSNASVRFQGQLQRAYQAYWEVHPSTEAPVSYNIASDIPRSQDIDFADEKVDITVIDT